MPYRLIFRLVALPPLLFALGCGNNEAPETIASTEGLEEPVSATTPDPNDGNLAIYDVDEDDPYKIAGGEFLGLRPGGNLAEHQDGLRDGRLRTGEGTFDVFYIDSAEGDELGYVIPDARDPGAIGSVVITATNVVTEKGVRVGLEFPELMQRLGVVSLSGSEVESRVFARAGGLRYRLDMASTAPNISSADVPAGTRVTEIWLGK